MTMLILLVNLIATSYAVDKIVVIDTGLNVSDTRFKHLCPDGHKDFSGTDMTDRFGHGTHIAGIIDKNIGDDFCVVMVKYYDSSKTNALESFVKALKYAISLNPKIVNISLSGSGFNQEELNVFKSNTTVKYVVSAGNNGIKLNTFTTIYPAQYASVVPNMIVVGALRNGKRAAYSNYGDCVQHWEEGTVTSYYIDNQSHTLSGTSQAAAVYTSKLARYGR